MRFFRAGSSTSAVVACCLATHGVTAQEPAAPTGAPPAEAKALVGAPNAGAEVPTIEAKPDGTTVSFSAGGVLTTGNSRLLALSGNGAYESRFGANGLGASILGNYGQGAPAGKAIQVTAENVQGRVRYDRFIVERVAVFLLNTGRHDRFQGLDLRYNLDPGLKYLFLKEPTNTLWVEGGYDLQHDVRRDEDRVVLDANKNPVLDAAGNPVLLDKTQTDHSTRLFFGFKHGFNKEVTLTASAEYLQSVVDSARARLNFDVLFAAKVGGGFAVGMGFSARYDHTPLPGKEHLDTSTTVSLIYAFSDVPEPPKPKTCPCPEDVRPPPPAPALSAPADKSSQQPPPPSTPSERPPEPPTSSP